MKGSSAGLPSGLKSEKSEPRQETALLLQNCTSERVKVCWVDFRGKELEYCQISPEQSRHLETFIGHAWVVRSVATDEIVHKLVARREGVETVKVGKDDPAGGEGGGGAAAEGEGGGEEE